MSTTEFYSDFAMTRKRRTKFMVFQKIFFKTLYHHRILTELNQISCEATPIRIHGTHGEHGKIFVKDYSKDLR